MVVVCVVSGENDIPEENILQAQSTIERLAKKYLVSLLFSGNTVLL